MYRSIQLYLVAIILAILALSLHITSSAHVYVDPDPDAPVHEHILIVDKMFCEWVPPSTPSLDPQMCPEIPQTSGFDIGPLDYIYFHISIKNNNTFDVSNVAMTEDLPDSFIFDPLDIDCDPNNFSYTPNTPPPSKIMNFTFPDDLEVQDTITCVIPGYFAGGSASNPDNSSGTNEIRVESEFVNIDGVTEIIEGREKINRDYNPSIPIEDVAITKTMSLPTDIVFDSPSDTFEVDYSITVTNNGTKNLLLGDYLQIYDELYGSTSYPTNISANITFIECVAMTGNDCVDTSTVPITTSSTIANVDGPSSWQSLFTLRYAALDDGLLLVGDSFTINFTVEYATTVPCIRDESNPDPGGIWGQSSRSITNRARIDFGATPGITLADTNDTNNNSQNTGPARVFTTNSNYFPPDPACDIDYANYPPPPSYEHIPGFSKTERVPQTNSSSTLAWGGTQGYRIRVDNSYNTSAPLFNASTDYLPITDVSITDIVQELTVPHFTAEVVSVTCVTAGITNSICPPSASSPSSGSATNIITSDSVWSSNTFDIPPDRNVNLNIDIKYTLNPDSCSTIDHPDWKIRNHARLNYKYKGQAGTRPSQVDTFMDDVDLCNFELDKSWSTGFAPTEIEFGTPYSFDLSIKNNHLQPMTIYTIKDVVRVTNAQYGAVPTQYKYTCSQTGGVSGYSPSSAPLTSGAAAPSGQFNGADIFGNLADSGGVTFAPGAILQCQVEIIVNQPADSTPGCLSDGSAHLQNTLFIHSELTPSSIQVWDAVSAPLPKCYEFVVNKSVNSTIVNSYGPAVEYTVHINNVGGNISGLSPSEFFRFTDSLSNAYSIDPSFGNNGVEVLFGSTPATEPNDYVHVDTDLNPVIIDFYDMDPGDIYIKYRVLPHFPTGFIQNDVELSAEGNITTKWFTKNAGQLTDYEDVEIVPVPDTSEICIEKYNDLNGNGIRDAGEPPLVNIPFIIRDSSGTPIVPTAFTDRNGQFCTERILPLGDYEVEEVVQEGWTNTSPGTFPPIIPVSLTEVSEDITVEFGNMELLGVIKLCKTTDDKIPAGTPFTFNTSTSKVPISVVNGSCKIVGTNLNAGDQITLQETPDGGYLLEDIIVEPANGEVSVDVDERTVKVQADSGVGEVTFHNIYRPAFIEICKQTDLAGLYEFEVYPAPYGRISVPANGCSPPIEVPAGQISITEYAGNILQDATLLANYDVNPSNHYIAHSLSDKSVTINIPPGTSGTQTIITFGNIKREDLP